MVGVYRQRDGTLPHVSASQGLGFIWQPDAIKIIVPDMRGREGRIKSRAMEHAPKMNIMHIRFPKNQSVALEPSALRVNSAPSSTAANVVSIRQKSWRDKARGRTNRKQSY